MLGLLPDSWQVCIRTESVKFSTLIGMIQRVAPHNEWEAFYDAHAPFYLQNEFTKGTVGEVDFLLSVFDLPAGGSILDVGCGCGRHSIELARRGYAVTGLDVSSGMLKVGARLAKESGVNTVKWVHADATRFQLQNPVDCAICVCEGAFNIIGQQEDPLTHDMAILANIGASLKPGSRFLLTALNGYRMIRNLTKEKIADKSFDPLTMISVGTETWQLPEGPTEMKYKERLYIPSEIAAMLHHNGFRVDAVYGGTAGNWARRPLDPEEIEVMFLATRFG